MVRWALAPLAAGYGAVIHARNALYDRAALPTHRAAVPVICIGNLTTGGAGKTPLVIEFVRRLRQMGRRPVVLSRGYAARRGGEADEVLELRQAVADLPVVVDADRVRGAARAVREHGADCVVMDDGFQHRRLARELDVLVIDALDPWGGDWLLPAGRLREPLSALRRAGLVIVSRANQVDEASLAAIENRIAEYASAPCVLALVEPQQVVFLDGTTDSPAALGYHAILPVCGLGNPASFLRLIEGLAGSIVKPYTLPDHHAYVRRDVDRLARRARESGADLVLTTRKDWVKLAKLWGGEGLPPLARLDMRLRLDDPDDAVGAALHAALRGQPLAVSAEDRR